MTRSRMLLALAVAAVIGLVVAVVLGADSPSSDPAVARPPVRTGAPAAAVDRGTVGDLGAPVLQYDDDPAGEQRLEGQVIDRDEQPVAGATVVIDSSPPREVLTEEDGSFAFDRLVGRIYRVEARAGDAIAGPAAIQVTPTGEPVVLRLRDAARLIVDVRSAAGDTPIAGALVELRGLSTQVATTDDTGRATIGGVGGGWHVVRASAPGHAAEYAEIATVGEPGQERLVSFRLRPGAAASGTVVDAAGAPIEGARVIAEVATRDESYADPRLDSAITDAKGRWRLTGLPRETVRFHAFHVAFAPATSSPRQLADGAAHDDVTITLERGARLAGRVLRAGGVPAPGAEVRLTGADARASQVRRVRADAEGRFVLAGLPRRSVHVMAADHGVSSAVARVELGRGEVPELELVLALDAAITGVVVTSAGEPVGEARVVAVPVSTGDPRERVTARLRGRPSTVADGDGGFRLDGLEPGSYAVRAIRPGDAPDLVDMKPGTRLETGSTGARIVVDDLTSLVGKVAFRDGRIPASFTVALGGAAPRHFGDEGGEFRIENVPSGRQYLVVGGPDLVSEGRADLEITPGEVHDLGTVIVDRGRTLSGIVVDGNGAAVAGAQVVLGRELRGDGANLVASGETPLRETVTGADGRFRFRGLGAGTHVLAADHDPVGRSPSTAVPAGTADLEVALTLRATGAVQGFVRRSGGVTDAFVMLRPVEAANASFGVVAGPDGSFRLDRVAPGHYLIWGGFDRGSQMGGADGIGRHGEVRSGEVLEIDLDLDPGEITVELRIDSTEVEYGYGFLARDDAGAAGPLPRNIDEARRVLLQGDSIDIREGMIVDDRRILLEAVKPGPYIACIAPLDGDPTDPAVAAEAQQDLVDWQIDCKRVTLAAAPKLQVVAVSVRPPR